MNQVQISLFILAALVGGMLPIVAYLFIEERKRQKERLKKLLCRCYSRPCQCKESR